MPTSTRPPPGVSLKKLGMLGPRRPDGLFGPISALRNLDEWPNSPAISRLDLGPNRSVSRRETPLTGC